MESHDKRGCQDSGCDDLMNERIRYFMGRHLTARDFRDEQVYHRSHRLFHNRMLHGWGVVCGLNVMEHQNADCQKKYVKVTPGMALDCCGREIVVSCAVTCEEQGLPPIPWDSRSEAKPLLLLLLCYDEKKIDPVPVLQSEGDCGSAKTDYGRVKETWKLSWKWVSRQELLKYGWKPQYADDVPAKPVEGQNHPEVVYGEPCSHDDCGDPCDENHRSCLDGNCSPDHCVPLAILRIRRGEPITKSRIFSVGRPEAPYVGQRLTHIADINWPHGGIVTPRILRDKLKGTLRVTFDRKLKDDNAVRYRGKYPGPSGVNEATFLVQYGEIYEDLDFVLFDKAPHLTEDGCHAEYHMSPRKHHHDGFHYLEGHTLWITVKCDFLLDCHGVRVDGNNNGVPGGVFTSWVSVVDDEECELLMGGDENDAHAHS
jgi:hypothetical protein